MTNVIMAGTGDDAFVELAGGRPGLKNKTLGRLYKKQILHMGEFTHPKVPGKKITVDESFAEKLVHNFQSGACDIVQAPIVDGDNKHTEDPLRNVGQVIDLDYDDKGVYAYLDARDEKHAAALGKTLIGASAMMNLDYPDTRTGEHVGPTLLHMAITNRPYITNLAPFEEVVGLSADTSDEETVLLGAVETEEDDMPKTKEELIAALKDEHGIDVDALLENADPDAAAELAALSNVLGGKEDLTVTDVAEAVLELSQTNADLTQQVTTLLERDQENQRSRATDEVDALIRAGRILPKQRDRMITLSMTDRETFDDLVPDESIVSLSEEGVTTHEVTNDKNSEVERYLAELGVKAEQ
jgi:hypothetical protein